MDVNAILEATASDNVQRTTYTFRCTTAEREAFDNTCARLKRKPAEVLRAMQRDFVASAAGIKPPAPAKK